MQNLCTGHQTLFVQSGVMEKCGQCGKRGDTNTIRRCSRCQAIRYCSRDCQARHWPQHKVTCTPTTNPAASPASARTATDQRKPTTMETKPQPAIEQALPNPGANLPAGPHSPGPWQRAKSRALAAFPGYRVVDRFDDLERVTEVGMPNIPGTLIPAEPYSPVRWVTFTEMNRKGVVVATKLVSPMFNFLRPHWIVVDSAGKSAFVVLMAANSPSPHFRPLDLQQGHFLCIRDADIYLCSTSDMLIARVKNVGDARVVKAEECSCARCGKCGDEQTIRLCSGCHTIRYCSRDCQKGDWSRHKAACKKARHNSLQTDSSTEYKSQAKTWATEWEVTEEGSAEGTDSGPLMACNKCGRKGRQMRRCGQCQEVTYCSRDCQRGDWKVHKVTCRKIEVSASGGQPQPEQREVGRNRTERERASRRPLPPHPTPRLTWEEARSRARRLYPGSEIVDKFRELKSDALFKPNTDKVVAVVQIKGAYPHLFRKGRILEDSEGMMSYVLFHNDDPKPYFRYDQLRDGNFLCYTHAYIHVFNDRTMGFRIDDPKEIHILEP